MRSGYLICLTILLLLFGCAKKEDKRSAQSKAGEIKEDTDSKPHPVLPATAEEGKKDKNIEQAERIMAKIHDYRERLDKNPKDLEALIVLGNANYDMKRYDKAEELYMRALEIDPKNPLVGTDLASVYKYTGKIDNALSELKKVLSFNPRHETALYNLGVILLNDKRDTGGAIKVWEELISYNPGSGFSKELQKKVAELKKSGTTRKEKPGVN
ncbi:MAG: tetratricopeptide repeat protein [Nitrospirae bacterium]|nr:tetratricopeptide repeat protein [Nitrospirota bacterium]